MFKKKPIYIVGIIFFTLILIADIAISLIPTQNDTPQNIPGMNVSSFSGEMPEGFDSESFDGSDVPQGGNFDFGGEMPEGFDSSQLPQGGNFDFDGEMPEGFDSSQLPQGGNFDFDGETPEGFDSESFDGSDAPQGGNFDFGGEMPEGFDSSNIPSRGQSGNSGGFLNTAKSVFLPILIICVLGDALCIFMLIRISRKKEEKQSDSNDEIAEDSHSRSKANTVLGIIAVLLVGAVVFTSLNSGKPSNEVVAQVSVVQAEASYQDIVNTFSGSGTLQSSNAALMEIPTSVTVTGYTVKNGDYVNQGDVIANVDKTSVQKAIYDVQALLTDMDAELAEVQDDTLENEITARADGRVKVIYVREGSDIVDAMYKNGAIMLISLGGSMTVVIDSEENISVGQTLTVTLSDGSKIPGKVQQIQDGKITVTTTDNGPEPDDTVTVGTEDGTVLGTGTLSISSPMKVTGYWGTADTISVKVGDEVEAGDILLTLNNTADTARYEQLLRERQSLTTLLGELATMYQSGTIQATSGGIISDIPEDSAYTQQLSASIGYTAQYLSEPSAPDVGTTPPGNEQPATAQQNGTYAGLVSKVTYGALHIKISETDMSGLPIANLEDVDSTQFVSLQQYSPDLTVPVNRYQDGQTIPGVVTDIGVGDKVLLYIENGILTHIDYIPGTSTPSQGTTPGGTGNLPGGTGNLPGGTGSTAGGNAQTPSIGGNFGTQSEDEDEEEAIYKIETATICAITPAETMTLDISVDELDVLTLAVGQRATIALDALPGQSFSGSVQKINPTGTNEGGSTKYTVTMEVPRENQMLPGMNASVSIEVSRMSSVLTVPAAAVYEDGNRTYVYTQKKASEPGNPVEVTTGASDGTSIEILSGLSQGDTVYYSYAESIAYINS